MLEDGGGDIIGQDIGLWAFIYPHHSSSSPLNGDFIQAFPFQSKVVLEFSDTKPHFLSIAGYKKCYEISNFVGLICTKM